MPSQTNINELSKIKDKASKAKSVIFADYKGLTVNAFNKLRNKIRENGGEVLVTKNTLLRLTFQNENLNPSLVGPTVAIFSYEDEIAPLKAVAEFNKEYNLPVLTAGFFDNKALSSDEVITLSKIPGKKELQAKIVGSLASPLSGMLNVLQGNTRSLVYVIDAIKNQKSN